MNKIIASLSAFALVAVTVIGPVNAASINNATAVLDGTLVVGQTITITKAGVFTDANEITSATITKVDGTAAGTTTLTATGTTGDANTSKVTIATADVVDNTAYFIFFSTAGGDFGVAQLNAGTPTSHTVSVSAVVEPTLAFSVTGNTVNFGSLAVGSNNAQNDITTLTFSTNATDGVVVSATGSNSGTLRSSAYNGTTNTDAIDAVVNGTTTVGNGTEYFGITLANALAGAAEGANFAEGALGNVSGAVEVANTLTGAAASNASVSVSYHIGVTALTPAGSYSGTVTYTAAPTF